MVCLEQRDLAGSHHGCLVGLGVVVPEHVQHAVDDEQRDLVVERAGVVGRVASRDRRADDHVAEQQRDSSRSGSARSGPDASGSWTAHTASASIGNASTSVGPSCP